jgi:hypothetical protein
MLDNEPTNLTAWCCYGRSMLHGTAVLWHDERQPIDDSLRTMVHEVGGLVRSGNLDEARDAAAYYWRARL